MVAPATRQGGQRPDFPFAPPASTKAGMKTTGIERIEQDAKNHEETRRSETFRWLRRRHARISKALARCQLSWASVAANIVADGVRGPTGREPSAKSVQQIWVRVCKQVEKEKRARQLANSTAKPVNRSPRIAKSLPPIFPAATPVLERPAFPPPVRAPPASALPALRPSVRPDPDPAPGAPALTDEAREELENLQRDFERADAWAPAALGTWKR